MKLSEFLALKELSIAEASAELGISGASLYNYLKGANIPGPKTMARIHEWSEGEVDANSFYGHEPPPGRKRR